MIVFFLTPPCSGSKGPNLGSKGANPESNGQTPDPMGRAEPCPYEGNHFAWAMPSTQKQPVGAGFYSAHANNPALPRIQKTEPRTQWADP